MKSKLKDSNNIESGEPGESIEFIKHLEPTEPIEHNDFRYFLKEEFHKRKLKNELYSIRAFARDTQTSPSFLVSILQGRRSLSESRALDLADQLKWNETKKKAFLLLIRYAKTTRESLKMEILGELAKLRNKSLTKWQLDLNRFRLIADWYHFALVEAITLTSENKTAAKSAVELANLLSLPLWQTEEALERLCSVGLIHRTGKLYQKSVGHVMIEDISSGAIKEHHRQVIAHSLAALQTQSLEEREFSTTTFAIDAALIPQIKEKIRAFRQDLENLVEAHPAKTDVYSLAVQFFRLTKS